jgi:hypothetical protein
VFEQLIVMVVDVALAWVANTDKPDAIKKTAVAIEINFLNMM